MNWNNNDTKYIIKRVLLYLIITSIVFFAGQRCAKAFSAVSTYSYFGPNDFIQSNTAFSSDLITAHAPRMEGVGTGTLVTSFLIYTFANEYPQITSISAQTSIGLYACDIGTVQYYKDNNVQYLTVTPKCEMMMGNGYFRGFYFQGYFPANTVWKGGSVISYVSEGSQDLNSVVAQQQSTTTAIVNAAQVAHADNQAIQQAISNEINQINANTQAINDLNDSINADLSPTIPTDFLDGLDGLFTTSDDNVIRQFLFIPINFLVIIYNAANSNSCSAITLGSLYGTNLVMPCIQWDQLIGSTLYSIIDTIMGCCILFGIIRFLRKYINLLFTVNSRASDYCVEVFK